MHSINSVSKIARKFAVPFSTQTKSLSILSKVYLVNWFLEFSNNTIEAPVDYIEPQEKKNKFPIEAEIAPLGFLIER